MLGGRYRMTRLLGRGGMGAVWVAHDEHGGADVAVKVVKASLLDDAAALTRFRREMAVVAGLAHDNIVRGLAAGEDDGVLWLAMELLHGQTLRERLDGRGRMPWQESLGVVRDVVRGLGAAHAAGVVHRDLKPENIMVVHDGTDGPRVKLLDFGVAKASSVDAAQSSMTGTGFIIGTPGYVAPEVVLEGKTSDPRSDFYALGVVWFELLTGVKPFTAKTPFALAMRHAHEPPPTLNDVAPFAPVPAPVEAVVGRLMAKSPDERPPDTATLLVLLDGLERAAAAAAAGTPVPNTFEPTVTDVRETPNTTAVVPIRLTPTPSPSATSMGTPATGLAGAARGPAPSDLHLFRQLPLRMKVALVAGAVLLPLVALGVVVAVYQTRSSDGDRPGVIDDVLAPPEPYAGFGPVREPGPANDHQTVVVAPAPQPRPPVGEKLADRPPQADRDASVPVRQGRANERDAKRTADRPPSRSARPTPPPPPAPPGVAYGSWSMNAPGANVKIVVDAARYQDPPFTGALLPVGPHDLVVLDGATGAVLEVTRFDITADRNYHYTYQPEPP